MPFLGTEVNAPPGDDVISRMLTGNKLWVETSKQQFGEDFFQNLSKGQAPEVCFIGCSDSRVPAERLTGMKPGELFVHRNIANVISHTDVSALSVLQFSVLSLGVKHVVSGNDFPGVIDTWLNNIRDVINKHKSAISKLPPAAKLALTVQLNVANSLRNVCASPAVREAWKAGKSLTVHGWVYDLTTGLVEDLDLKVSKIEEVDRFEEDVEEKIIKKALRLQHA
ncbi:hypothetical protein HDU93_008176 [Gonapodya sp. JEL0774]|nr:hypothetical protein HDU93_008176 [Gonapodya sp. JEL0774]